MVAVLVVALVCLVGVIGLLCTLAGLCTEEVECDPFYEAFLQ